MPPKRRPLVAAHLGSVNLALLFVSGGISTIATKYLMNGGMSPYQALCYSSMIGVVLLMLIHRQEGPAFYRLGGTRRMPWSWLLRPCWALWCAFAGPHYWQWPAVRSLRARSVRRALCNVHHYCGLHG